jgi:tetratricopeptide (TPR) repeat protein
MAELFYITANLLSSQAAYSVSNFYLNLAMYLNPNFISYKTLYAENFYSAENLSESKKTYKKIKNKGNVYNWHAAKQIAIILLKEKKSEEALNFLKKNFKLIKNPDTYEIFEYAEFLKNNERFQESIIFYSKILKMIDKKHNIYHEVTEGRGVAYERFGDWDKAEKDLLSSLSSVPNQAYVINYLAYSWIEKGLKINQSLQMLEKANNLKKNDGYILDSLGWALFKLNRYKEAKKYLQQAVRLMPSDPIVNDHYGDSLWMIGKKIQARYYWNYVLNLEKTEIELREKVNDKLIFGPKA